MRCVTGIWWNILAVPKVLLAQHGHDYFVQLVFKELQTHITNGIGGVLVDDCSHNTLGETVYDAHTKSSFTPNVQLIALLGDLPGRCGVSKFPTSYSDLIQWCHICYGTSRKKTSFSNVLRATTPHLEMATIIERTQNPDLKEFLTRVSLY
jgi:hypothetical protein